MLFNSVDFALFLPLVFGLYWAIGGERRKLQNTLLWAASYVFYGWWDWRFLGVIVFSTTVDFVLGREIAHRTDPRTRKILLWTSLAVNLGLLGYFKYANFFLENFVEAFRFFGGSLDGGLLHIVLPVGISFYTFQTLSYTIDVYRGKIQAERDPIAFATFVAFFPQLVAGPIERASNLLPQFAEKRKFSRTQATDGMRQILWGLFKKIVIADQCAPIVNHMFENPEQYSGLMLVTGAVLFAFQLYGDFSGYSDVAIGTAKLFGFRLMKNFATPYFARDISDFWRRWHISLSTWFRDYVYIPLGGSRGSKSRTQLNMLIVFVVSGFWHGANWTFIVWGTLHGLLMIPLVLLHRNRDHLIPDGDAERLLTFRRIWDMGTTFLLWSGTLIFFRAENIGHAWRYLGEMTKTPFLDVQLHTGPMNSPFVLLSLLVFLIVADWLGRGTDHSLTIAERIKPNWMRYALYYSLIISLFYFATEKLSFIYFQF